MESKMYLEEFLDKLTKMLETKNQAVCIKYIDDYKSQVTELIENELFREATFNFLDELVKQIKNESNTKIYESTEEEEIL